MRIGMPPLTPYLKIIMIVCGAVWLLQILLSFFKFNIAGLGLEQMLGVVPVLVVKGFVWQPLTYMFLHSPLDPFHILLNLLFIWMFGGELERHWGSRAFLRYYLVCGVGAGVFITIWAFIVGTETTTTIGASGALFGLIIAFGMIFADRTVLFMLIFPMKARTMAMILFGITFFLTFRSSGGLVSHAGHLGGALTGFLYLKRAWRIGDFYRELKWKLRRRRFKVIEPDKKDDFDRWVN
jgi:membrane associated rhomboid family serine protease